MSNQVDERVVEMRFDNQNFEKNVSTSLSTLDKLKQALNFSSAAKGLSSLETAGKSIASIPLSTVSAALDSVSDKFSIMGTVGDQVIRRLTDNVMDLAGQFTSLIRSMSIDQIGAGWTKFGEKTKAVQTIVAQGFELEDVNDQMERLNWFTDETSYNFTDMVNEIGKFTATGQDLEGSVTAMEGIALWAAASGQNATTASRAMYQLSQAMGVGALRYQDYKSIQNANMDTKEFREQTVQVAEALGVLKKTAADTYKVLESGNEFSLAELFTSDALTKENWINKDVMMGVFQRYAEAVEEVYNYTEKYGVTASEAIEALGDQLDPLALKWFKAGQEARTFEDVIESVKDAVSTGWMNTFEKMFGNAQEATEVWTWWANALYDVFAASGETRNEILQLWKDVGGRDNLVWGIANAWSGFGETLSKVGDVIKNVFGLDHPAAIWAKNLRELSESFYEWSESTHLPGKEMAGLLSTVRSFAEVAKGIADVIGTGFSKVSEIFKTVSDTAKTAFHNVFGDFTNDRILSGINAIKDAISNFTLSEGAVSGLSKTLEGLFSVLKLVLDIASSAAEVLSPIFSKIFGEATERVFKFTGSIGDYIKGLVESAEESGYFDTKLRDLGITIINVWTKIKRFIDTLGQIKDRVSQLESFKTFVDNLKSLKDILSGLKDSFLGKLNDIFNGFTSNDGVNTTVGVIDTILGILNNIFSVGKSIYSIAKDIVDSVDFSGAKSMLESIGDVIQGVFQNISGDGSIREIIANVVSTVLGGILDGVRQSNFSSLIGKVLKVAAVAKIISGVLNIFEGLSSAATNIAKIPEKVIGVLSSLQGTLKSYALELKTEALKNVAIAIALLVGSLWLLTKIDSSAMSTAIAAMMAVVVALSVMLKQMDKVNIKSAVASFIALKGIGSVFTSIAFSMLMISAAIKILTSGKSSSQDIAIAAGILTAMVGVIALIMLLSRVIDESAVTKMGKAFGKIASAMLIMSAAIKILTTGNMAKNVLAAVILGSIIDVVSLIMLLSRFIDESAITKMGNAFIKVATAMGLIALSIKILTSGETSIQDTAIAAGILTGVMTLIGLIMGLSHLIDESAITKMGNAFLKISIAMTIVAAAIKIVASIPWQTALASAIGLSAMMAVMTGVVAILSKMKNAASGAAALLATSIAVMAIAAALAIMQQAEVGIKAIALLAGTLLVLAGVGAIINALNLAPALMAVAKAVLMIGAVVLVVGAGVLLFAAGIELLSKNSENIPTILSNLGAGIVAFGQAIENNAGSVLAFIGTMLVVAVTAVAVGYAISKIVEGMKVVLDSLSPFLQKIASALPSLSTILIGGTALLIAGFLQWLTGEMGNVVSVILQLIIMGINSLSIAITENGYAIGQAIGNLLTAIFALIVEGFWGILEPIVSLIPGAEAKIKPVLDSLASNISSDIRADNEALSQEVNSGIDSMKKSAQDKLSGGIDVTGLFSGDATGEAQSAASNAARSYKGTIADEMNYFPDVDGVVEEKLNIDASAQGQSTMESWFGGMENVSSDELLASLGDADFESVLSQYTDFGGNIPEGVASGVEGSSGLSTGAILSMAQKGSDAFTSFNQIASPSGLYEGYGENVGEGYAGGIRNATSQATSAARNMAISAAKAASNLTGQFATAGRNAGLGFVKGLQATITAAAQTAAKIAQAALEAAKKALKVNSPSRAMAAVGSYAGEGFINGLKEWIDTSELVAGEMANRTIDAIRTPMQMLLDALNADMSMAPVITPVLDTSKIQNGSKTIGQMLGNQRIGVANLSGITADSVNVQLANSIDELKNELSDLNTGSEITITINAAPGQDPDAIAARVERRLKLAMQRKSAVLGG